MSTRSAIRLGPRALGRCLDTTGKVIADFPRLTFELRYPGKTRWKQHQIFVWRFLVPDSRSGSFVASAVLAFNQESETAIDGPRPHDGPHLTLVDSSHILLSLFVHRFQM
jgi:hypothetical protein